MNLKQQHGTWLICIEGYESCNPVEICSNLLEAKKRVETYWDRKKDRLTWIRVYLFKGIRTKISYMYDGGEWHKD